MKKLTPAKWALISLGAIVVIYIGSVIQFETRLAYLQPQGGSTIVIATTDGDGSRNERVVSLREFEGKSYIAANHWPRAWYRQALNNPQMEVKMEESFEPYLAVPLEGAELAAIQNDYQVSFQFKFRTGFPPRRFLRLDPQ